MDTIMKYLAKAESEELHKVDGEKFVTSAYGIARKDHPDAEIWEVYDAIAEEVGVVVSSKHWTDADIALMNNEVNKAQEYELVSEFYEEFLEDAMLHKFPDECKVAMMSMYTNSPANAWKAVQMTLLDMESSGTVKFVGELSTVDGEYGRKTRVALEKILDDERDLIGYYMETLMLSNMKTLYGKLAVGNYTKYGKYLRGWLNRMDELEELR